MTHRTPLRILIVEDDNVIALSTRRLLEREGHEAHVATNGAEAVSTLNTIYFDIVLMDVEMPCMNGLEATRAIRGTDDPIATIPIIALTGTPDPQASRQCFDAGMNEFIPKPFSLMAFEKTLRRMHNRQVFSQAS